MISAFYLNLLIVTMNHTLINAQIMEIIIMDIVNVVEKMCVLRQIIKASITIKILTKL